MEESLTAALKKAIKAQNLEAIVYYREKLNNPNLLACSSFEIYKGSGLVYENWKDLNCQKI